MRNVLSIDPSRWVESKIRMLLKRISGLRDSCAESGLKIWSIWSVASATAFSAALKPTVMGAVRPMPK
jgi:hypothetical protein